MKKEKEFEENKMIYKPLDDVFFINKSFNKDTKPFHKKIYKYVNATIAIFIGIIVVAQIFDKIDIIEYLFENTGLFLGLSSVLILQSLQYLKRLEIPPKPTVTKKLPTKAKIKSYLHINNSLMQALIFTILFLLFILMPNF